MAPKPPIVRPSPASRGRPRSRSWAPRRRLGAPLNRAAAELVLQIQRTRAGRLAVGHRPEQLELQPVGILGVERQAGAVIGLADQRARLDESLAGAGQVGQLGDFPGGVIHAGHSLVGRPQARLLEETEVVVVAAAGNREEGGARIATLDLEAEHVAVEAHAALDVADPQHEVLQAPQPEGVRHRAPSGYSRLTVIDAQAISVSEPGTRRPPATGVTVTPPRGSSLRTRPASTAAG